MKKIHHLLTLFTMLAVSVLQAQTVNDGRRLTRNEQYEDAEKVFNSLIAAKPKAGDAYYYAGLNYLQRGDTVAAAAIFDKGLLMSPKYTLTNVGKGYLMLRAGKTAEAEALFAIALKSKKKALQLANKEVARAYLKVTDASRARLVAYAQKALDHLNKADNLTDNEVQLLIGDAYAVIDPLNLGNAVEQYQISSRLNAKDPLPRLREANVYQRAKNFETAMERINQALAIDGEFAPAYRQKADLFAEMGNTYRKKEYRDSAVLFYQEYLKRNNNFSARRNYVQSLFFNQEFDKCIQEGIKLQAEHEFPNIWGVISYAVVLKNDTSKANNMAGLDYFAKYEEKHVAPMKRGLSATEKYYKSVLLFRTGSLDASYGLLSSSLSDTANTITGWYDQGFDMFYKTGNNYSEALHIMELKQVKMSGILQNRDMYYKAQCMNKMGRYMDAVNTFREILQRDSSYTRGYFYIAQNYYKMDPKDSIGILTPAYEDYFKHLTENDKTKNKNEVANSYKLMGYVWFMKANKVYVTPAEKAAGYVNCKAMYAKSNDYYRKSLEYNPNDEVIKKQIEDTEKFVAGIGKKRPAAGRK